MSSRALSHRLLRWFRFLSWHRKADARCWLVTSCSMTLLWVSKDWENRKVGNLKMFEKKNSAKFFFLTAILQSVPPISICFFTSSSSAEIFHIAAFLMNIDFHFSSFSISISLHFHGAWKISRCYFLCRLASSAARVSLTDEAKVDKRSQSKIHEKTGFPAFRALVLLLRHIQQSFILENHFSRERRKKRKKNFPHRHIFSRPFLTQPAFFNKRLKGRRARRRRKNNW